ncbi:methyltransferase domain-containing protein [Streptomyces sp. W16]|uniref:class I SAM-dependent methyltransferase n=1 Tax=Streptomyces sp. W16 TaxID=3076631 RepID=UPI00295C2187|nr:methyltransferase domain-containing protein [Streptomyces sp. W16]MDV9169997.1 methyltransferase domain-containing protein [Streptomyces sp. W16]
MKTPAVTAATGGEPGRPLDAQDPEDRQGPRTGDAIGDLLLAAHQAAADPTAAPVLQIIERDDGFVKSAPLTSWLAPIDEWPDEDRQALDLVKGGRVLDIGAGGGRAARVLMERGHDVTALDVSPGALEVCRQVGVKSLVHGTVDEHAGSGARYDSFLLLGANLGLLESRERAPQFLRALAAMAAPGAVIIGQGHNMTDSRAPQHLPYNRRNLRAGRIAGQRTMRIRYRDVATPWFHYLCLAPQELAELAAGTGWQLTDIAPFDSATDYIATLTLTTD